MIIYSRNVVSLLLLSVFILLANNSSPASPSQDDDKIKISYEDKLEFYLNRKSKQFLNEMAQKEKLLLGMIENITREIKMRGEQAILKDEVGYEKMFGQFDQMIHDYSNELENVLGILTEIRQLEKVVEQVRDLNSWQKLNALKYELIGSLDDRELYKKGIYTRGRVSNMFKEYFGELDSVLAFGQRLDRLERFAKAEGDLELLKEVENQRREIKAVFGGTPISVADSISDDYVQEASAIVDVLRKLDDMEAQTIREDSEISLNIEELRRSLLEKVDRRLLLLLGYETSAAVGGPTVSEIFKQWKARQTADYEVRFTQYKIMITNLLKNSSASERSRMLDRDLRDAFSSYVNGNYALAELQFDEILQDYAPYFNNFESVCFYRAETYFSRQLYDEAVEDYDTVVKNYPDSPFVGDALARLMLIYERQGNLPEFFKYFQIVKANASRIDRSCNDQCNYLAGYIYFKQSKFDSAQVTLARVTKDSKYYLSSRYLMGVVNSNQKDYSAAIAIFQDLANKQNYPWTDPQTTFIRNNALLKLGYIYYELGEFEKALSYFQSVSPGFDNYDRSLLGAAWTNLKQGDYENTIDQVNLMFRDYLASNYTYEALVLAAHCKRILDNKEGALRDLRYVANARGVLELSKQYNEERKVILDQLSTIDQLEDEVLDRQDKALYNVTSQMRDQAQQMLFDLTEKGETGTLMIDEFQRERQEVFKQIEELNKIIQEAQAHGKKDVVNKAYQRRERLLKALETYQADMSVRNVNYFIDYPLATKEGSVHYRKNILNKIEKQMEDERQRISANLQEIKDLKKANGYQADASLDLEILEKELENLKDRSSRFRAWVLNNQVDEVNTKFDQWADFSGFGMSDITFQSIAGKDQRISEIADNVNAVNQILKERRLDLTQKVEKFDEEVKSIEEELKKEKIEIEKQEKEKYFEDLYFDTRERESEEQDTKLNNPKDSD